MQFRDGQKQAFSELQAGHFGILNAPTGWGKSLVLCGLAGDHLLRNARSKVVMCIPQTIIAKGFVGEKKLTLPDGALLDWRVGQNYCDPRPGKVSALTNFLLSPAGDSFQSRVAVTTHKGLAAAFQRLTEDEKREAIREIMFVFDEAHHLQAGEQVTNQLGAVLKFILASGELTVRVLLATAFFFRGDRLPILGEEDASRFRQHSVAFDEYWNSLKYLSSYRYDFVMLTGSVWSELDTLLANSQEPTIIYCPPEGHKLLAGLRKAEFAARVSALVRTHYDAEEWTPGVMPSKSVVLDLVDPANRAEKIRFATAHGDRIAVILTVAMFREGADWVQAQRVIDLLPTGSDQDRNQRFGRLLRDHTGKTKVSYLSFFPRLAGDGEEERRRMLTKLYAHFHASLVLENALIPIRISTGKKSTLKSSSDDEGTFQRANLLGQFDVQTEQDIIGECCDRLTRLAAEAEQDNGIVSHVEAMSEIAAVLGARGIETEADSLAKQIVLILRRRSNLALPVDELVEAGFDRVWASDALDGLRLYSAGVGGPNTFQEIRRAVYTVFDARWNEWYEQIKDLPLPPNVHSRSKWWISYNQQLHAQEQLSAERVTRLEQIAWWTWRERLDDRFERHYDALKKHKRCPSPSDPLYPFVAAMRYRYKLKKLTSERITRLEAIPWWKWQTRNSFEGLCREVAALEAEPVYGSRLYQWVWRTRTRYAKGELIPEEIKLVETIPWWTWQSGTDTLWRKNYKTVARLPEPPVHSENPKAYKFVYAQRNKYKSGKLSAEQIKLFEEIPWWKW